ncbi:hypothetical protein [Parapedobacter sp. DT-150]|uniref:hypothetical protein n=1 Tax=Parapedobacter sp. DT-150 TaxID=3396162 RepID=UPI003F1AF56C
MNSTIDTLYNHLFTLHPDLDSIHIEFDTSQPVYAELYFGSDSAKSAFKCDHIGCFDLTFEGDRQILREKHGAIFSAALIEAKRLDMLNENKRMERLNVFITRDTSIYKYDPLPPVIFPAYKSGIKELETTIKNKYVKDVFVPQGDSILIFQSIVNRDKTLGDIGLIYGERSSFSEFVLRCLRETGASWVPMTKDGRVLRSLMDIYVRLNSDESISVSVTGRGRRLKIKDNDKSSYLFRF